MQTIESRGLTLALGNAGLAAGTTTTISIATALAYAINGYAYSKAIASNQASPTTDSATGAAFLGVKANKGSVFVIGLDSSGNTKAVQGEITDLDAAGNFIVAPEFPAYIPDTVCPVGYLVIKAGSTADATTGWILGSSNTSGVTGITYSFKSCAGLPVRPQVA